MYRIKSSKIIPKYIIDVEVVLAYNEEYVAASDLSIKKKYKLDDLRARIFKDILQSVEENIRSRKFEVLEVNSSKKGNTGYITFYPITIDGVRLDAVKIKFRISDHDSKTISKSSKPPRVIGIVSFLVTDHVFNNSLDFILEIDELCEKLQQGNLDAIDEFVQHVI